MTDILTSPAGLPFAVAFVLGIFALSYGVMRGAAKAWSKWRAR